MNIQKVCVLGGSGFVGGHVLNKLEATGVSVRVLTRSLDHARDLGVFPDVDVVQADVFDPVELERHFAGMDAVINLIGILHQDKPTGHGSFQEVHVELPRKIVRACAATGVERLLHMSALNADPKGPSAYLRSKGEGQAIVMEAGMPHHERDERYPGGPRFVHGFGLAVTVFRPSVIFGREDHFLNLFARLLKVAPVFPLASPEARFQPVYVEDVARAFTAALDNPATFGNSYDLCGPKAYTLRQLVEWVGTTTGHARPVLGLGPRLSYLQAWMMEWKPGRKMMTRDNYYSMQVDAVCKCEFPAVFGFTPSALDVVAPPYLNETDPYRGHRLAAGR